MTRRFLKFNAVGALGISVQLGIVSTLTHREFTSYMLATTLGIAAAVLHNFVWHVAWTWGDRRLSRHHVVHTFTRFVLANGATSLAGSALIVPFLVQRLALSPVFANIVAIAATGMVNYALADRAVFRRRASISHSSLFNLQSAVTRQ